LTLDSSNITLSFTEPNKLFQVSEGGQFGELDGRTAKILINLGSEGITFQISCRASNRRAASGKKGSRKVGANEAQYVMNAIIYGPEGLCDAVGLYLTKCGVYLQDPQNCDGDYIYANPHILSRTEDIIMTSSIKALTASTDVEQLELNEGLFAELSADDHLALTEAPDAINKPLYV
jgi:SWI/SNF-related matrix-associated actin-dependent regulator of chromatin subfamily A3